MIVAVLLSAGLLVWLGFASRPEPGPAMVMDDEGVDVMGGTAQPVTAQDFGANIGSWVGQNVNLTGVTVSTVVNDRFILIDVPTAQGTTALTVHLLPGAAQTPPAAQSRIDVEGRVLARTDSVLNAWQQEGAIADQSVRSRLENGQNFIEASTIRPASSGTE